MERTEVQRGVAVVSQFLRGHAGGITLDHASEDGEVRVAFTGMCTGCMFRPVTMATTIRPALLQIEGVTRVEAAGARVDDEVERRMQEELEDWWRRARARRDRDAQDGA